jgi:amphi-Trp domain-containing protein
MDLVEIKQKDRMQREEAAARLRQLADQLSATTTSSSSATASASRCTSPDEIQLKVELEIGDDGSELEVELTR